MHRLVAHAQGLRQLGRLYPPPLTATGDPGPWRSERCPRAIRMCQRWSCTAFPAVGPHRAASCGRDSARPAWPRPHLRFKSNKKKGSAKTLQEEEEDEDEEQGGVDPESSDYEEDVDETANLPKDYKDIEKNVQSFRYDVIMKSGLDMARK